MKKNFVCITLIALLLVIINDNIAFAQESNPCFSKVTNPDGSIVLKVNPLAACVDTDGNGGRCEQLTGYCLAPSKTINSCLTRNFSTDGILSYSVMGGASCTNEAGVAGKCDPSSGQCITNFQINPCLKASFTGGTVSFTINANAICTTNDGTQGKCTPVTGVCSDVNSLSSCFTQVSPGNYKINVGTACVINSDGTSKNGICNSDGICNPPS